MFDNSDEYDFASADSSKLAALFGNYGQESEDSNSSLMYTAPKQPNYAKLDTENDSSCSKSKSQSTVMLAKVVSIWKLEDKEYKALGKHGLAVIGSVNLNLFEIIAYKEKNNIILRTKVNDKLLFYHQKDEFSSFYDDDSRNWLIKFQNDDQKAFYEVLKKFGAQLIANEDPSQKCSDSAFPKPALLPKPKADVEISETQTDSSGSQQRAHILSRMAKMGQQILPKMNSSDNSDSELGESRFDRKPSPRKFKKHIEKPSRAENESTNFIDKQMVSSSTTSVNSYPNFNQSVLSPMMYAPPMNYEGFIISQNAELKMSVAQLSAKLDSVLTNNIPNQKNDDTVLKSKIKALELKTANLQDALGSWRDKYHTLERKYNELSGHDHRELSEKNSLIDKLEREAVTMKSNLTVAEERLDDFEKLKFELQQSKNDIKDCQTTIEIQKLKLKEQNKDSKDLQATIDTLNDTVTNLRLKLADFEGYFERTESEKREREKRNNEKISILNDMIKMHMNEMYQSVIGSFSEGKSVLFSDIQSEVAKNLKGTTFRIIEDLKTIYTEETNDIRNE
nr:autophagy-related protein 23-like isoform X1 [Leptinotarsa decemlineata]XP_023024350.1 autophagy-related protein 23-like isoform X2 [Leptinotarsa decemlineata]